MKQTKSILTFILPILTLIGCATQKSTTVAAQLPQEQIYVSQTKVYLDNESSLDALTTINKAIAIDKSNPSLYILQAQAYEQQKDLDHATTSYNKAISLAPKNGIYLSASTTTKCTLDISTDLISLNKTYDQALQLEQNNDQNTAQIYADKGNCLVARNLNNDAIPFFESAITSSNPPISAYTGITKAYIEEGNYPKAALMINSIPNNEQNRQIILLKIDALSGLLNKKYSIKDKNRKILINKIEQLQQQLQQPSPAKINAPIKVVDKTNESAISQPKPMVMVKPSSQTSVTKLTTTKSVPQSLPPQVDKINTTKLAQANTSASFDKRVKHTSTGKKYIVIQPGDTLFNISVKSGVSKDQIIKINHFKNDFVPLGCKVYLN